MNNLGVVIVASGYGSFRNFGGAPFPKVLELIHGEAMIARVARAIRSVFQGPVAVTINNQSGAKIRETLSAYGFSDFEYVVRFERAGAADALSVAMKEISSRHRIKHVLSVYADMPLWQPETLRRLIRAHEKHPHALTMITVQRKESYPVELDRYGRVVRDPSGKICRIIEPAVATSEELAQSFVNPSLWIWDVPWFLDREQKLQPVARGDGFPPERQIPPLAEIAHLEKRAIQEIVLNNPIEALGVNNLDELRRVQKAWSVLGATR